MSYLFRCLSTRQAYKSWTSVKRGGEVDQLLGSAQPRMSTQPRMNYPCFFTVLLVLCSLLSCSDGESCDFSVPDQQWWGTGNHTTSCTFDQMDGDLFLTSPAGSTYLPGNLGSYMKNSSSSLFNSSDTGLFIIPYSVILWENMVDLVKPYEASFSVTITLNAYRTQANNSSRLIFALLPRVPYGADGSMSLPLNGSLGNSIPTSKSSIAGSHVSVQIGSTKSNRMGHIDSRFIWLEISIEQVDDSAASSYAVWIDYNGTQHHISVYVDDVESVKPKPTSPVADIPLIMSDTMGQVGFFSLLSSMGQLLQLHAWSSTVEQVQLHTCWPTFDTKASRSSTSTILSLVLSSAVVSAIMVSTACYCYFNSEYRRWKKDLDKLAKSMQHLPGMPVHVKFTDIMNATNNFHETTVLGRGTFGVVYRCRLPTLKNEDVMLEVAVKMFTRDDSRRYEDFLTEVTVISRLRHKNIVSLVGKPLRLHYFFMYVQIYKYYPLAWQ